MRDDARERTLGSAGTHASRPKAASPPPAIRATTARSKRPSFERSRALRLTCTTASPLFEDVIDFYFEGGRPNPSLDSEIRPRNFTAEEKRAYGIPEIANRPGH